MCHQQTMRNMIAVTTSSEVRYVEDKDNFLFYESKYFSITDLQTNRALVSAVMNLRVP
jgi:hypothetical protein